MKGKGSSSEKRKPLDRNQQFYKKIGHRIRKLRKEKGFPSYDDFAWEADISRAQYGRYERGIDMKLSSLLKVLATLKVSPAEFFKDLDDIP